MGASQGIGVNLAERLYEKNCSTILVARTESKLQHQIQNIKEKYPESSAKISYAVADVSNYDNALDYGKQSILLIQIYSFVVLVRQYPNCFKI